MGYSQDYLDSHSLKWCSSLAASDRETIAGCSTSLQQIGESTSGKSAEIDINCQAALSLGSSEQLDTEGRASNEVIDDVDGNGNGDGVLSDRIIDELEKMCYYTADFVEDIDEVINNEDFRLIYCAAEEVDDLNQDEHYQSLVLTCQRILDSSGLHDDVDEAAVV